MEAPAPDVPSEMAHFYGAWVTNAAATEAPVPQFPAGHPISAVVSDCGLAATYMVPSPINPNYRSLLVTYTWDDDSTKLEHAFAQWPQNISPCSTRCSTGPIGKIPQPPPTPLRSGGCSRC